jgi:Fe-S cluster biosynthesis and repair protein YggX
VITHRFEPRVIQKKHEFGEEKNTYILDGVEKVAWNGLKYRYDWHDHRAMLIGEALAHLVETDKDDREYLQPDEPDEPDDEASTLMAIAKDLMDIVNEDSKIVVAPPAVVVASEAILEEKKVEETDDRNVIVL